MGETFEIPMAKLNAYLSKHIKRFPSIKEICKLAGGQSNPTYLVTTEAGRYVMRRKPPGQLLKSAHAIDREYRVLRSLAESQVPVPKVFHYCADEDVIGSAFYVMEYVCGHIYWDPQLSDADSSTRLRMYDEMNRVLATLHLVNFAAVGLRDFGRVGHYFDRQIRRWTEQYRATETERRFEVEQLIEWLPINLPTDDGQICLVHGDYRLDNMVFDDSGQVIALLDWELSTLGHPYADLAYQCAQWRLPTGRLRGLNGVDRRSLGIPSEGDYVDAYCKRRGLLEIRNWSFYLVLSLFRLAAICQGVYRRGLEGNASSTESRDFGERTAVIAACAVQIVSESRH
jgi:aminoglycoside phosphotransferase (APT) family kinase protein